MTSSQTLPDDTGRRFVRGVHETLLGAADALGDLDRRAGDGDFGTNVRTAMKLVADRPETDAPTTHRGRLTALCRGWLVVGGTCGPLFGVFCRDLAKAAATGDEGGTSRAGDKAGEGTAVEADAGAGEDAVPTLAQLTEALAAG